MPGCSWNFFSEPFCEMHSVVTVKTVVHFTHAISVQQGIQQNKVSTVCNEITNHLPKNRRCR